jgi:hypothetical protein
LESAYQSVVDAYGVYNLDFDIEGGAVWDTASITMRSRALAQLQQTEARAGHNVQVSLTLPVIPSGFPTAEMNVIQSAASSGVSVSVVNAMTMDYGDGAAPNPAGQMGAYAIQSARSVEAQLAQVYPTRSASQLWAMVGITPMIRLVALPVEHHAIAADVVLRRRPCSVGAGWQRRRCLRMAAGKHRAEQLPGCLPCILELSRGVLPGVVPLGLVDVALSDDLVRRLVGGVWRPQREGRVGGVGVRTGGRG